MPLTFSQDFPRSLRRFAEAEAARLGLAEWRIDISFCDGEQLDKDHGAGYIEGDATIEVPWRHGNIRIRKEGKRVEQKRTIAHEIHHVWLSLYSLTVRRALRGRRVNKAKLLEELADVEETIIESMLNARTWR